MTVHHPVFARYADGAGTIGNWLGVATRRSFFGEGLDFVRHEFPSLDTEYFEWVDVLESVVAAEGTYAMLELGAGYGRWIVNAAAAARGYNPHLALRLVAVEAEPTHFAWLKQHCRDNRVKAELIRAAVTMDGAPVEFAVGDAESWYGQAIADGTWSPGRSRRVKGVTLSRLLRRTGRVDLIHMDVQGLEADVLEEAGNELIRVARLHVGTHGPEVENRIRRLMTDLGWTSMHDYPSGGVSDTPYGRMTFQDGIQTWLNPSRSQANVE